VLLFCELEEQAFKTCNNAIESLDFYLLHWFLVNAAVHGNAEASV
jgi:hypothetical protein